MSDNSIEISGLSRLYKLYPSQRAKLMDMLGAPLPGNKYEEFWALKDINMTVKRGERLGIIGRNGAGKTTLLKIIGGMLKPTTGNVSVTGKIQALMEMGTGFHPDFTGRQNIFASLSYQGIVGKGASRRYDEIVDFSELEDFIDNPVKTYSAGMYARLAFSVATAIEPEILIIDEILGAGDAYFTGKCMERMTNLTKINGATVLFVSHNVSAVQSLCDRAIWLKKGEIFREGDTLEISKAYYREVQEEENLRLQARSSGLSKKMFSSLMSKVDKRRLLFHFVTGKGGAPVKQHKIRSIRLSTGDRIIGEIDVGEANDTGPTMTARALYSKGHINWSDPEKDDKGTFRRFADYGGIYVHAAFEFDLIGFGESEKAHLRLTVEAETDPGEMVYVEVYAGDQYKRLGALAGGENINEYDFDLDIEKITPAESAKTEKSRLDIKDSKPAESVKILFQPSDSAFSDGVSVSSVKLITSDGSVLLSFSAETDKHADNRYLGQTGWDDLRDTHGERARRLCSTNGSVMPGVELPVASGIGENIAAYRLAVRAFASPANRVLVYLEKKGRRYLIGEIPPEGKTWWRDYVFDLDIITNLDKDFHTSLEERPAKSVITTGEPPDPRIEKVLFLNSAGEAVTGIEEGENLAVEVNYFSSKPVSNPVFAMTIYTPQTINALHANTELAGVKIGRIHGRGRVRFVFSPLLLGPGEYVVSASIFKYLDVSSSLQPPYYDQHDRAYLFRVWKKLGVGVKAGLILNPYRIECESEKT